jgi:hypothetical protein
VDYPRAVDAYISTLKTTTINYAGREWTIYDDSNVCCLTRSIRYRLPAQIMELVQGVDVMKLHGCKLTVGLYLENWHNITTLGNGMMGYFDDSCYVCGTENLGYSRYHTDDGHILCESCSGEVGYTRSHITDTNLLDWVKFMREDYCSYRYWYYVNCNPDSDRYGSILCNFDCDDSYISIPKIVCSADSIVDKIHEWFHTSPSQSGDYGKYCIEHDTKLELNPSYYIDRCVEYLDGKYASGTRYRLSKNFTRRYVLEHMDDLNGNSEDVVNDYVEYFKRLQGTPQCYLNNRRSLKDMTDEQIVKYAQQKVAEDENKKIFDAYMIDGIQAKIYGYWLYGYPPCRSFGMWISGF